MTKSSKPHLRPQPPTIGVTRAQYMDYLSAHDLYLAYCAGLSAARTQGRKDMVARQRDAATRGSVVLTRKEIKVVDLPIPGQPHTLRLPEVETKFEEAPQKPGKLRDPIEKAAAAKAKRKRYRANRALRNAKAAAELSKWQLVERKNKARARELPRSSIPRPVKEPPAPEPSKKEGKKPVKQKDPPAPKPDKPAAPPQRAPPTPTPPPAPKASEPRYLGTIPQSLLRPLPTPKPPKHYYFSLDGIRRILKGDIGTDITFDTALAGLGRKIAQKNKVRFEISEADYNKTLQIHTASTRS